MLRLLVALSLSWACTSPRDSQPAPETEDTPAVEPAKLSPIHPTDHVELSSSDSSPPTEVENGELAYHFGTTFMKDTVSKAKTPVNLHTRGITLEPGSEAKLYLANQQGLLIPYCYIGTITAGQATQIAEVVHEVKGNARDELRSMAHFGIVMVVSKGSVKVERFILSVAAE